MPPGVYIRKRKEIKWKVTEKGCHNCTSHSVNTYGYPQIQIDKKHMTISKYVYEKYKGALPKGNVIRHTCDNPLCINPDHLIPGTPKENSLDMVLRNRSAKGERHGNCKLSEEQVKMIRSSNLSTYKLASIYNVTRQNISMIKKGLSRKKPGLNVNFSKQPF
ncbi:MAG TPA: HNH endonuclease [Hanamia sp.]|nr:HNH endonuclease [Hanamia sp.]